MIYIQKYFILNLLSDDIRSNLVAQQDVGVSHLTS